ncbi:Alcohol dehydrogenase (plasmid) [Rhodococcus sp. WAY2]|nr:Alcohol dehydrogenase [Rhodococcus sp. WAY2]
MYLDRDAMVHKVPDGVLLAEAALLNPLASAIEWSVLVPETRMGADVVVLGAGQRGLLCVAALREAGAGTIVVTGLRRDAHKLEVALKLGADRVVCVEDEDVFDAVSDATGGTMADVVIDVTPNATQPIVDAIRVVKRGGTIILAGVKWGKEVPGFVSDQLVIRHITMRGVQAASSDSFAMAMRVLERGRHPLHLLHSHSFPLDRAADAIRTLSGELDDGTPAISVTINPSMEVRA